VLAGHLQGVAAEINMRVPRCRLVLLTLVVATGIARAQDAPKDKPDDPPPVGLPSAVSWKFNFDAGWGGFGFGNSLFTDPKEGVRENFGERWMEGFMKPAIGGTYKLANSSEVYGKVSAVGERTYATPPPRVGPVESSFLPEDLYIGWRSAARSEAPGDNAFDFNVGRAPFRIGHGFLIWDGAAEGGSRGGYWSNARKAFGFATIGRFKPGPHTIEGFYLRKDDLPEHETGSRLAGANYEYRIGESSTFGATYMKWWAKPNIMPQRQHLDVYNLRAYTAPVPMAKDLSFELEYAAERNHDALHADAWTAQAAYQLSTVSWKPKLIYRYAAFEGDDPATPRNEAFDPLFLGFYDWGTWWQGEIAGEYFLSNSNLKSHLVRAHVSPSGKVGGGVMFYKFLLDHPESYAPGVTDKNLAFEVDGYTDWKINRNFTASFVLAFADPHKAVQQSINRTASFRYGMVFLAYSY
jgi:hypothetical protein